MTPRPALGLERWGKIHFRGTGPYVASCYYRDDSGRLRRMERQGRSKAIARVRLEDALHEMVATSEADLTRESTLAQAAETWWVAYLDTNPPQGSVNRYRRVKEIIVESLGELRIREVTVPLLDRRLNSVRKSNGDAAARVERVVLSHIFTLAVRLGAAPQNPVANTRLPRPEIKRPEALPDDVINEVQEALRDYDARPRTGGTLQLYVDLLIATGARPGEVLALTWDDSVDLEGGTVAIVATVGEDEGGSPVWQPHPKTEAGFRRLTLPEFAIAALLEARTKSTSKYVIPNRNGGLQSRSGIGRAWRAALSKKSLGHDRLVGITPRSFRKTVATLIARELGPDAAAQQLGNGREVAEAHYIERVKAGPVEARKLLERLVKADNEDD